MNYIAKTHKNNGLSIWDEMDRVFDNFLVDAPVYGRTWAPLVDVRESENEYVLEAELPGLTEADVDVKVEDNLLTISSAKKEDRKDDKNGYLIRERRSAQFSRSFVLPKDVDAEKIDGVYKNGILSLHLAKKPEAKPKSIKIKVEK
ncbi:MAG: Hsp20/alpha crystallin family protein [Spirochaetales bacterium]|nr:Hsp20/alpha crystallin family protein [Spirochaetales bacterium]